LRIDFTGDELILALISLLRATDPRLLRQGPEGFSIDLEPLEKKTAPTADERLLLRLHAALAAPTAENCYALELSATESSRLAETLASLEQLHEWAPDVLAMSRNLREKLERK